MTGSTSDADEFATLDAAYVLGALSPNDRRDYETHLRDCGSCDAAVRELAGMPGLLARVPATDVLAGVAEAAPPDTLLPGLLGAVRRERRRSRRVVVTLALSSAACLLVALLVAFWPAGSGRPNSPVSVLTPAAGAPIRATAQFTDAAWGTEIRLRCTYAGDGPYGRSSGGTYTMLVTDRQGHRQQLGTWRVTAERTSTVDGTTSLPRSDIASVDVRTTSGRLVLHLK